ncbi:hypothetical protein [Bifidobacterium stellenboschense]|uniref:Uncharacterized protein n=1 Tax=Bifidobacterium stellenboschense TaxID=762211 RepID=A0A087DQL1_9BIFI|nr:hypothetical protein [Bifidobacterium stellenboschense]KFI97811.1 hypothetical protein BSTEL_0622 [Bifidobacterium stellenboschense]
MRRVYGLDPATLWAGGIRPLDYADLAANLPDGSMVWRRLDSPRAWTTAEYLLAAQVDQLNLWMWANNDPRKRGDRPDPLPRPGTAARRDAATHEPRDRDADGRPTRTIRPEPMTVAEFERFRAQRFEDVTARAYRPHPAGDGE